MARKRLPASRSGAATVSAQPPCQSTIRTILMSVDPAQLARADAGTSRRRRCVALAIDGKTLRTPRNTARMMSRVSGHDTKIHLHPKKVGLKPGADDVRTNEIGTALLLDQIGHRRQDPHRRCVAASLRRTSSTQRRLPLDRQEQSADLAAELPCSSPPRRKPNQTSRNHPPSRGLPSTSTSTSLASAKMIRRARHSKATGKASIETAYGVTSHTPDRPAASGPATDLKTQPACDASPSVHQGRGLEVAQTLRKLNRNVRCVFDFLKID